MAFMQQQVTVKRKWLEIEGSNGTTFVDAEDVPARLRELSNFVWSKTEAENEEANELAAEYYDGHEVYTVTIREGYGARLSAPGYMDCTEWSVFDTEEEARKYLDDTYGDDEEDDEA